MYPSSRTYRRPKWLFFAGVWGQKVFPVLTFEHLSIDRGSTHANAVRQRLTSQRPSTISKTNRYLPDNSQISVSLHNGPRIFTVTGPPRALYGLGGNLCKICAPNGSDQSKVEFFKRKPCSACVSSLWACQYLPDKVIYQDLNGDELR